MIKTVQYKLLKIPENKIPYNITFNFMLENEEGKLSNNS